MTPDQEKPAVAIVDDDPRLLESLGEMFESAGYEAHTFASASALLLRGLAGIDALITDIGMPQVSGFDLRDLVCETHPDLPVFLITGRHEIADLVRASGATGFLRKPFDPQALLEAVSGAVERQVKQ